MAVHPCGAALAVCLLIPAASRVPSIQNQLLGFMAWVSQGSLPHDPEAINGQGEAISADWLLTGQPVYPTPKTTVSSLEGSRMDIRTKIECHLQEKGKQMLDGQKHQKV